MDAETGLWLLDKDAGDLTITPRRQEIIDVLAGLGQASISDVATATEQNRGNAYTRLQDLVEAGLVTRTYSPGQPAIYTITTGSTPDGL
jgi:predicted transcriptional regulator